MDPMDLAQTLLAFIDVCALLWTVIYSGITLITFWCIAKQSTLSRQLNGRMKWAPTYVMIVPYFFSIAWLIARAIT